MAAPTSAPLNVPTPPMRVISRAAIVNPMLALCGLTMGWKSTCSTPARAAVMLASVREITLK
jgi:hypothetical protein